MAYCTNCGQQLADSAKFCSNCGASVEKTENTNFENRKTVFEGNTHKCPNCGEILNSFLASCPSCGCELRDIETSKEIRAFNAKLSTFYDKNEKIDFIREYPVPNSKEAIWEFVNLASANISAYDRDGDGAIDQSEQSYIDAWKTLQNRCRDKAKKIYAIDSCEIKEIEDLIDKSETSLNKGIQKTKAKKAANILSKILKGLWKGIKIFGKTIIDLVKALWKTAVGKIILVIALIALILAIPRCADEIEFNGIFGDKGTDYSDTIVIGINSDELSIYSFLDMQEALKAKGFNNITVNNLGWIKGFETNKVVTLSIDGRKSFNSTERFSKNSIIVINYAGEPQNKTIGLNYFDIIGLDYQKAIDMLEANGFTNIELDALDWEDGVNAEKIISICVDGKNAFLETDEYLQNVPIVIQYYKQPKNILIEHSAVSLVDKVSKDVKTILVSMGFTDIKMTRVDLEANCKPGNVKRVTINGNDNFSATDYFKQNSSIIIYYYDDPYEIIINYVMKDFKGKSYSDVEQILKSLGFINIEIVEGNWNLFQKSGNVKSVTINGNDEWNAGDEFLQDAKIVIEYYK